MGVRFVPRAGRNRRCGLWQTIFLPLFVIQVLFSAELKTFETRVLTLPRTQEKLTPRKKKADVKREAAQADAGTPVKQEPAPLPAKGKGSGVKVEVAPMPADRKSRKRVKVEPIANGTQSGHPIDDTAADTAADASDPAAPPDDGDEDGAHAVTKGRRRKTQRH